MSEAHTTQRGTPCANTWTPDWIAVVEAREESLERPICGARLMSGNPCTLVSTHPSGRCRYHGGFDLTGAPEGNRNAVIHNLYSRRLMPCGPHCPVWKSCLLGGGAKDQGAAIIKLDPADRPTCPYEQTEYNTAVTDALQSVPDRRTLAYARHIVHMLALAQVMVTRAGLALREAEFTKVTVITGEKYHMTTPKVAPALAAYEKLERAWRRLLMHFDRTYVNYSDRPIEDAAYTHRSQSDTALDPDTQTQHYQSMIPLDPKKFYRDIAQNEEAVRPRSDTPLDPDAQTTHYDTMTPDSRGGVARQSGDSGLRRNDIEESETGGPHSTLAATGDQLGGTPSRASESRVNAREDDAPGGPDAHHAPPGSARASHSQQKPDQASAASSAEGAPHTSLGQRPRTDDTPSTSSPEGASQSPLPSATLARAP